MTPLKNKVIRIQLIIIIIIIIIIITNVTYGNILIIEYLITLYL